jgi:hypothetical protein
MTACGAPYRAWIRSDVGAKEADAVSGWLQRDGTCDLS